MLTILSPAKNMAPQAAPEGVALTCPREEERTRALARALGQYPSWELEGILDVNPGLALDACQRFQQFRWGGGTPALLTYHGIQFQHIAARDFTAEDWAFAQEHLRVLSALYGVVRPLDAIRPYRLEFGARWAPEGGRSLYRWWGGRLYEALRADGGPILNLASQEYARAVSAHLTPGDLFVTVKFLTLHKGKNRQITPKIPRGEFARWLVKERVDSLEGVKEFGWDGFTFEPALSTVGEFIFLKR